MPREPKPWSSANMGEPASVGIPGDLFAAHARDFNTNRYVYPVLSRRSRGLSIGVNLNLEKWCNFHCVYCQVVRQPELKGPPPTAQIPSSLVMAEEASGIPPQKFQPLDLPRLRAELTAMVEWAQSGRLFTATPFCHAPPELRRFNDIAFSGDGEPTAHPDFAEAVSLCAEVRRHFGLDEVKLVLITNGSLLHLPQVATALEVLDANNGEIWAKLDTGTEAGYRQIARSTVPWTRILQNLRSVSQRRPIVIQSLFARLHDVPPAAAEIASYCDRLNEILVDSGQIKLVQVYTVARTPAENWVTPLSADELSEIADEVRRCTGLPVMVFPAYAGQD